MAMRRNNAWSGHAAAKATRTRVAVSVMRAAILRRRVRRVVNSALARGCGLSLHKSQLASDRTSCRSALRLVLHTAAY